MRSQVALLTRLNHVREKPGGFAWLLLWQRYSILEEWLPTWWARALEYGDSTTASAGLLTSRILYSGSVLDTLAL